MDIYVRLLFPLLLVLTTCAGEATAQPDELKPLWTRSFDEAKGTAGADRGLVAGWSPTGNCLAVRTSSSVHVVDQQGRVVWTWRFATANRFIQIGSVAPSADCNTVAAGGGTDYRYVWIVRRHGPKQYFKLGATPTAVRFSLDGAVLAVATALPGAYVLTPEAVVLWKGRLNDLPVRWPSKIAPPDNQNRLWEFAKSDVDQLRNSWLLSLGRATASEDGTWAVDVGQPNHGGGDGWLWLWEGREKRWDKAINCPDGLITRDGQFVIASGDLRPDPEPDPSSLCDRFDLYVFNRSGDLQHSWPDLGGQFVALSPDDRGFLVRTRAWGDSRRLSIERRDFSGKMLWMIPLKEEWTPAEISPDGNSLVVCDFFGRSLSMYRLR